VPYYVVNTGRGRSTHIMKSSSPSTPDPMSPGNIAAQLIWFGGNPKHTLCGLQATRYVNVFTPSGGILPRVQEALAAGDCGGCCQGRQ
jgi:hypothetical protein